MRVAHNRGPDSKRLQPDDAESLPRDGRNHEHVRAGNELHRVRAMAREPDRMFNPEVGDLVHQRVSVTGVHRVVAAHEEEARPWRGTQDGRGDGDELRLPLVGVETTDESKHRVDVVGEEFLNDGSARVTPVYRRVRNLGVEDLGVPPSSTAAITAALTPMTRAAR